MTADEDIRKLTAGLDRQREIYTSLRDLSRRQGEIIHAEGGIETLLELLGRKQVLINEIEIIESEIAPLKRDWEQTREEHDSDVRSRIEDRVGELREILGEVLELEERGRTELEQQQGELAGEIRSIGRSREAHRVYGGKSVETPAPRLLDNTG